jgi:hypothetical protein
MREGIMNHTKGKWEAVISNKKDDYIIWAGDEGVFIATTQSVPPAAHETGMYGKQANANLIAAAPELFKALKYINKECVKMNRGDYDETPEKINYVFSGIWKKAEEAIARAEGE